MVWLRTLFDGLPRTYWYLWLGTLINRVGIFVVPFLSLYLTSQRHLTIERATLVVSCYGIGSFSSQIAGGFLADHLGRRLTMLISLFGSAAMLMILSALTDYGQIAVAVLLVGFSTDLYRPASSALIADVVPPESRAHAYSLRYWAINLGASIGLSLGGLLASHSYILLFIGDAGTTAIFGLIMLFLVPETRPNRLQHGSDSPATPLASPPVSEADQAPLNGSKRLVAFALLFAGLGFLTATVYGQNDVTLPLAMHANGFSEVEYGLIMALNGIVIVLVSLPLNRYLLRYPRFRVIAIGAMFTGVGFGLYALPSSLLLYGIGVIVWTVGELIYSPLATAIIADISPVHQRGFYQGLLGAGYGLSAFAGPIAGGFLYGHYGASTLWVACLGVCCLVSLAYLGIARPLFRRLLSSPSP